MNESMRGQLLQYQQNEITEHHIYTKLAQTLKSPENRKILEDIATDELRHSEVWKTYTKQDILPDRWKIWKYYFISRILGFTFGIKLMERGEEGAQENYKN